MAKVYFITALILGQALVFVDGQTSSSMSISSNSNAPTSSSSSSMSTRSTTSTANGITPTSSSITLPSTTVTTSSSTSTTATTSTSSGVPTTTTTSTTSGVPTTTTTSTTSGVPTTTTTSTTSGVPTTTTTSTTSGVPTTTTTSTTSGVPTTTTTSTPSGVPTTTTTSTPSGVPTTTTTSTPSGVSTTATTSTPSSVTTPMTTSVSASLSTTSTNSISSSLSTTTTTTTTSTSSRTSTTTTTSASSSMAPPIPGTVVIICLYVRLPSCNSNEHGNVSSPQTQALFGNVSTNLRNIYKEGQTEFIGLLDLQSSACSSNIYVVFYIKVTFIRGIFPSGVTIVNVFTTNIADGLLGNLPVSSTQYNITFQGVTITRSVKDGECQSVCCGAGGPITFVEQCTSGVCEGFQGKETMEAGHCDGGANDACKNVDCGKDGSGASSRYAPSFALLMLLTAASFLS